MQPVSSEPDVKKHLEEVHRKFAIVMFIKHQAILDLSLENIIFPEHKQKYLQIKMKIQHHCIHKHKNPRRNLLKLTSNT